MNNTFTLIANGSNASMFMLHVLEDQKEAMLVKNFGYSENDPTEGKTTFTVELQQMM